MVKEYFVKCFFYIVLVSYAALITKTSLFYISHPIYLYQTDLMNFITGAMVIKEGKAKDLYNDKTQLYYQNKVTYPYEKHILLPFRNIPLVGFLYIPFTYMSLKAATMSIFVVNLGLLILFYKLFTSNVSGLSESKQLLVLTFVYWPSVATLISGQIMGLILIIFALIFFTLVKKKYTLMGVLAALLFIRPQTLLILPLLLVMVKNKKKFLVGFILSGLIIFMLNIYISGINVILGYPKFVFSIENAFFDGRLSDVSSVYFTIRKLFPLMGSSVLFLLNSLLYLFFIIIFFLKRKSLSLIMGYSASLLITLLFSIHMLSHDLIILLIPIYSILSENTKKPINIYQNKLVLLLFFTPFFYLIGVPTATTFSLLFILFYFIFPDFYKNIFSAGLRAKKSLLKYLKPNWKL